jgi:peptidoglycan hydrolase-like protein with peptidoglycan-binding domain
MEERIKLVQKFFDLEEDGILGKELKIAIEVFQYINDLKVTGKLDDETYNKIYDNYDFR